MKHSKACLAHNQSLDCHGYWCLGVPDCDGMKKTAGHSAPDFARLNANIVQVSIVDIRTLLSEAQRPAPPALLTIEQIAYELGVSHSTLCQLRREGLPCIRVSGRPRFELADVLSWLRSRGGKPWDESEAENSTSPKGSGTRE